MKIRSAITALLLAAIILTASGCKKAPPVQSGKPDDRSEQLWSYGDENSDTSAEENANHIERKISAKCTMNSALTRTVRLDLDLPEVPTGTFFEYSAPYKSGYEITDIMQAFYGEETDNFVFMEDVNMYHHQSIENTIASLDGTELTLTRESAFHLSYSFTDHFESPEDTGADITENDAAGLCDKFLSDCGITGYSHEFTLCYGKTDKPFYVLFYGYELNSLPCYSQIQDMKGRSYLSFAVDDNEICEVKGFLYDDKSFLDAAQNETDTLKIISPLEAIEFVEKQAGSISVPYFDPKYEDIQGFGTGPLYILVNKMELGYWFSEHNGYKLAWVFGTEEEGIRFAVDAIDGSLLCDV